MDNVLATKRKAPQKGWAGLAAHLSSQHLGVRILRASWLATLAKLARSRPRGGTQHQSLASPLPLSLPLPFPLSLLQKGTQYQSLAYTHTPTHMWTHTHACMHISHTKMFKLVQNKLLGMGTWFRYWGHCSAVTPKLLCTLSKVWPISMILSISH